MKLKRAVLYSLFVSLFAATLAAQTPTGTLEGTVVDQTGGAVASATVRIVNLATNEAKQLTTDSGGRFTLLYVNPGTYTVTVTATGFGPAEERNIKVDVGQVRTLPFTLTVGQVSEKVEVNAEATPLDISTSTIGTVIDNRKVNDLPLLGSGPRNPFSLAELTPAVNNVGGASTPHMAGSRNAVNEEQLDGITNIMPENNVGNNVAAYTPIVDSIQEFNVQINSTSAEYGRFGGGVINVVTKSGTNQWHGGLFFFDQATVLDANDFFANRGGQPRPNVFQHEYGGTVGGPVAIPHVYDGHNKTFAFFGFEGTNWERRRPKPIRSPSRRSGLAILACSTRPSTIRRRYTR